MLKQRKRKLLVPTKTISNADFMRLQEKCDAELRASGFRDIEFGYDLNLIAASTFRGAMVDSASGEFCGGHGMEITLAPMGPGDHPTEGGPDGSKAQDSLFDTPRARAWALFGQAAHDLPTDDVTRAILVAVADGATQAEVGRQHGISKQAVNEMVHRLCKAIGIDQRGMFSAVTDRGEEASTRAPAPVRKLTKREVKRLRYESPGERRAS